jgi:hypothetical protein
MDHRKREGWSLLPDDTDDKSGKLVIDMLKEKHLDATDSGGCLLDRWYDKSKVVELKLTTYSNIAAIFSPYTMVRWHHRWPKITSWLEMTLQKTMYLRRAILSECLFSRHSDKIAAPKLKLKLCLWTIAIFFVCGACVYGYVEEGCCWWSALVGVFTNRPDLLGTTSTGHRC